MNENEIFITITSVQKWYAGVPCRSGFHNAQSANRLKKRFYNGCVSEKTLEKIFNHFGYIKNKTTWSKN